MLVLEPLFKLGDSERNARAGGAAALASSMSHQRVLVKEQLPANTSGAT
jgi:hypothetical protein